MSKLQVNLITNMAGTGSPTFPFGAPTTPWSIQATNFSATSGDKILADTSAGSFTITLPATPAVGDTIEIFDGASTFNTYPVTVDRNGSNILGLASNFTLENQDSAVEFIYFNETRGWVVKS